jgi:hypothetical protein
MVSTLYPVANTVKESLCEVQRHCDATVSTHTEMRHRKIVQVVHVDYKNALLLYPRISLPHVTRKRNSGYDRMASVEDARYPDSRCDPLKFKPAGKVHHALFHIEKHPIPHLLTRGPMSGRRNLQAAMPVTHAIRTQRAAEQITNR